MGSQEIHDELESASTKDEYLRIVERIRDYNAEKPGRAETVSGDSVKDLTEKAESKIKEGLEMRRRNNINQLLRKAIQAIEEAEN